jgi:folate-binding protein YgfZ
MTGLSWFEDRSWTLVRIEGSDRVDFLHRLTTNILPHKESPLLHNFFLSVNARIQSEFWVSAHDDHLALLTPSAQVEALAECIERYHFGEKIDVVNTTGVLFVVSGSEPQTLATVCDRVFAPDPRYGDDCCWCYTESPDDFRSFLNEQGEAMTEVQAERRRVALGRPRHQIDYDDTTLFVEVAQQGDFSETKGCYPGQEIVARVLHRGRLNRHLRGFESKVLIPADWELKVDGKAVANVKSTVATEDGGSIGYLLVRREYGEAGGSLTGADQNGTEYTLTVKERTGEILTGGEE